MPDKRTTLERGRRQASRRHDDRHRRVGVAPQADGDRARDARSPVKDLTVVSYGGPDVGLLCAAGKVRKVVFAFVSLDSIALEPHFRNARQAGEVDIPRGGRGNVPAGAAGRCLAAAFLPTRAGLGSDVIADQSGAPDGHLALRDGRGPGRHAGPDARRRDHPHEPRGCRGQRTVPRARPLLRRSDTAWPPSSRSSPASASWRPKTSRKAGCHHTQRINRLMVDGVIETPNGAHFTSCVPGLRARRAFQKAYAAAAAVPEAWQHWRADWIDISEAEYQRRVGARDDSDPSGGLLRRGALSASAATARSWPTRSGTLPRIGGLLAELPSSPTS